MSDNKTECTACGAEMIDDRKHGMTSGCGYEWLPCCSQECHDMLKDSEQGIDVRPPKTYTIRLTLTPDPEGNGELPTLDQIAAALAHSTAAEAISTAISEDSYCEVSLELIDDQARPLDRRKHPSPLRTIARRCDECAIAFQGDNAAAVAAFRSVRDFAHHAAEQQAQNAAQAEQIDRRELATILAALRAWQGATDFAALGVIATNDGEFVSLHPDEIDALCERLNAQELSR